MDDHDALLALAALANEHRLKVFRLLVRVGPGGLPAGEIASKVGVSPTALSFHLKELDRAGLIVPARDGRYVRYAVKVEGMRALLTFLTQDCCQGRPELCGPGLPVADDLCGDDATTTAWTTT